MNFLRLPIGKHEGLTTHQVVVLELIRFKSRKKGYCWGKQTEMAQTRYG